MPLGEPVSQPIYRPWFDAATDSPLLTEYARKLDSFHEALADRRVDREELEAQEKLVVDLMKEVEQLLDPERFVGRAPQQVREFLAEHVRPVLADAGELPAAKDLEV